MVIKWLKPRHTGSPVQPLMTWLKKIFPTLPLLILCTALVFCGCEGSEQREQVDDTVKELSGQKNVERFDQMKKDIADIEKTQEDRMKQTE